METELDETISACMEAVGALARGERKTEDICIHTRSLLAICKIASSTYSSLLVGALASQIGEVLLSAANAVAEWSKQNDCTPAETSNVERTISRSKEYQELLQSIESPAELQKVA